MFYKISPRKFASWHGVFLRAQIHLTAVKYNRKSTPNNVYWLIGLIRTVIQNQVKCWSHKYNRYDLWLICFVIEIETPQSSVRLFSTREQDKIWRWLILASLILHCTILHHYCTQNHVFYIWCMKFIKYIYKLQLICSIIKSANYLIMVLYGAQLHDVT